MLLILVCNSMNYDAFYSMKYHLYLFKNHHVSFPQYFRSMKTNF